MLVSVDIPLKMAEAMDYMPENARTRYVRTRLVRTRKAGRNGVKEDL